MKTKLILPFAVIALLSATLLPTQTGCSIFSGGGTNTFNANVVAAAIKAVLGPVVVFEENADPSTIADFQTASAALGVMISNNSSDAATLSNTLQKLGKNDLTKLAIAEAVSLYQLTLAQSVSAGIDQNATAKTLLQAIKDALDQGVKAQAKRLKAHRRALRI